MLFALINCIGHITVCQYEHCAPPYLICTQLAKANPAGYKFIAFLAWYCRPDIRHGNMAILVSVVW